MEVKLKLPVPKFSVKFTDAAYDQFRKENHTRFNVKGYVMVLYQLYYDYRKVGPEKKGNCLVV